MSEHANQKQKRGLIVILMTAAGPTPGARLCRDRRWRQFANFGDYPECVMVYKNRGAAILRARRTEFAEAVELAEDFQMDAAGCIFDINGREVPDHCLDRAYTCL